MYDLASPNKCQPLFLDHDDETDENGAVEVDEVEDEVDGDDVVREVDEDEETEANRGEEVDEDEETEAGPGENVQQTVVVHEGTTLSPWMLAFFLPLLFAVGAALFPVFQAAMTSTTVLLRIGETFAPASNNGSDSTSNNSSDAANNNSSSHRRRRAARRRKTGRTRIGRILKCAYAGGRRFRPARSRRSERGFWVRGRRRSGDKLLVMDDDSAHNFKMVLAFLRGGANPSDQQQVCIAPVFILFLISPPSLSCVSCGVELMFSEKPSLSTQYFLIAGRICIQGACAITTRQTAWSVSLFS